MHREPTDILAIDPGPEKSGWVIYNTSLSRPTDFGHDLNGDILRDVLFRPYDLDRLVIERIRARGMAVGNDTMETCEWVGRFAQAWDDAGWTPAILMDRQTVKLHLCGTARAKDSNIRQALLDRFPRTGGGQCPQKGTKNKPGPLYGMAGHHFAALALAITHVEMSRVSEQKAA